MRIPLLLVPALVVSASPSLGQIKGDGHTLLKNGLELKKQGDLKTAVRALTRAAELLAKEDDVGSLADAWQGIAECENDLRRHESACTAWHRVLLLRRKQFGEQDRDEVALALDQSAMALYRLRRGADALPKYEAALAMYQRLHPGDHSDVAWGLSNVAVCLRSLGQADKALPKFKAALAMAKRLYPDDDPGVALSLNNMAACLWSLGRPDKALPLYEEALSMRERLHQGDHPDVARSLNNLADCLWSLGHADKALTRYEAALAMRKRLYTGDHSDVAVSLDNVAVCLRSLGRAAEALPKVEAALAMSKRLYPGDHPHVATSLNNLASCLRSLGRSDKALPLYEEALGMRERLYPGDHPDIARSLSNLASSLRFLGRAGEALPLYKKALAMLERLFPADHPDIAQGLNNLADCFQSLGQAAEALPEFEEALAMERRLSGPNVYFYATGLARASRKAGKTERAHNLLAEAVVALEQRRAEAVALDQADRATFFQHLKRFRTYDLAIRTEVDLDAPGAALGYLERARGRAQLDLLQASAFDPLEEVRRQAGLRGDEAAVAQVDALRSQLVQKKFAADEALHAIRKERDTGKDRSAELRAALRKANEAYKTVLSERARLVQDHVPMAKPVDASAMQALLKPDEAALAFYFGDDSGFAFFVPPTGRVVVTPIAIRLEKLSRLVQGCLQSSSVALGHVLFKKVVPAVLWQKLKNKRRVYVLPHGPLHHLPLEALVIRKATIMEPPTYWLDEGPELAYATSGSMLQWTRRRREAKTRQLPVDIVALGNPVFGGKVEEALPPEEGCLITRVPEASLAAAAGLRARDVLLRYGEYQPENSAALRDAEHKTQVAIEEGGMPRRSGPRCGARARPWTWC